MAFDRNKYKGANLKKNEEALKEAKEKSYSGKKNEQWEYHKITEGKNVFRVLPPHDANDVPFQAERKTYLKCEVDKLDGDRNPTGEKEIKNKGIFIATVHGLDKEGNPMMEDPVEKYIEYVYKRAKDEFQSKDDRDKFLQPITGYMSKEGFKSGIRPQTTYVYYALKDGDIGRLTLYESMTKKMEEISLSCQDDDEPDFIDVFSDPDDGVELVIKYDRKAEKGKKYLISKTEFNAKKQSYEEFIATQRVSDEVLERFDELKPLKELYGAGVYKKSDFYLALDGLKRFDDEHGYCIFANDEFLDELEKIEDMIPDTVAEGNDKVNEETKKVFDDAEEPKKKKTPPTRKPKPIPEPEPEEADDEQPEPEGDDDATEVPKNDIADRLRKLRNRSK